MVCCCGDVFDHSRRFFGGMNRACLRRNQLWNADQVVGDQIEHEVGSDAKDAAMLGLAHGAMLLTPAKDAFYHRAARLRHAIALVPRGARVDGAFPPLAGLSQAIVLRDMRGDVLGAKIKPNTGFPFSLMGELKYWTKP